MKSLLVVVSALSAYASLAFPIDPSFTPEAVREYKMKADAGDAESQYLYSMALAIIRNPALSGISDAA